MTVGHNKAIAIMLAVFGVVSIGLWLQMGSSIDSTPRIMQIVTGGFAVVLALVMTRRPLFSLEDDRIVIYALLGPLKREYRFAAKREVAIRNKRLYVGDKRLPIRKYQCDRGDWDTLVASLTFD